MATVQIEAARATELRPGLNRVTFPSDGETLVGNLFLPPGHDGGKLLGVVVGGSWTTVKEQMAGLYARRLALLGFAALAFDARHFGESGGEPRQFEDPASKIEDFRSAGAYLRSAPVVDADRVAALGVCASAGYLAHVVAETDLFKAFATVAGWLQTPEAARMFYGGEEGVLRRIGLADAAAARYRTAGESDFVAAYDAEDPAAAMFFELPYYAEPMRGAVPSWTNRFDVRSWRGWLTFDALQAAPRVAVPTLVVHSDQAALPEFARRLHDAVRAPKALYWTLGEQTDFYDREPQVSEAVAAVTHWFRVHMA